MICEESARSSPACISCSRRRSGMAWDQISHSARYERLRKAIHAWLHRWGSRVSGELMLTETNYWDDPVLLLKLLAQPVAEGNRVAHQLQLPQLLRESFQH